MERFHLDATTPEATAQCARALAACLHKGEWVALAGIVGAGKTHFARAAIHYLIGADEIVPSPSFTLVQYYAHILHADFYRISDPHEIGELGIIEDLPTHIGFIEWAENAAQDNEDLSISPSLSPSLSPSISLGQADYHVMLQFPENSKNSEDKSEDTRIITIDASPPRLAALRHHYDRQCQIDNFLATHNFAAYSRHIIAGDASGRSYQRLIKADTNKESVGSVILMDWQIGQDTQDIYNGGIDYVRAARLAEDTPAMCRIMKTLASHINVATIYAADEAAGLVLAQDFGTATLATTPEAARPPIYLEAIETLLTLHTIPDFTPDFLGAYDGAVCAHEASLFVAWYLPYRGINITEEAAKAWHKLWQTLGDELYATTKATIILRDYHSVNLHWQNCAA
ncbi:MAG: tRNA (adenosine(37)-N6)-threonylcarbamoyltransferase complex ATPase subunit type 1 TsaE, partial [Alphaproteobacteria bacterium]|nr:tRNA (adenosine(37)-N6)-threonylcarbamoyltransferase complex ATPase subunit type 1 TsaE [Alphaproteobacteria bacterium]